MHSRVLVSLYGRFSVILPTNFHPSSRFQTNVNPLGPSMRTVNGSSPIACFADGVGPVDQNAILRSNDWPAWSDGFQPSAYFQPVPSMCTSRKALPLGSSTYSVSGDGCASRRGSSIAFGGAERTLSRVAAI